MRKKPAPAAERLLELSLEPKNVRFQRGKQPSLSRRACYVTAHAAAEFDEKPAEKLRAGRASWGIWIECVQKKRTRDQDSCVAATSTLMHPGGKSTGSVGKGPGSANELVGVK